ncbi:hypothetical protein [uncultured Ruegeria sp.]|uniref:hypothetical protein n=1 Tax=uncultured Ruegeria sp. TaxID=259304 RepID=UPI002611FC7F|nr:hypothetical protein [uncultured Ruegeria sp.]
MPDNEGSGGTLEDAVAAKTSQTWESRLKEAREKRAAILARAPEEVREEPELISSETENKPPPDEPEIEEIISDRVRSLHLDEPQARKKPINRTAMILAALVCGAFLQWAVAKFVGDWRSTDGEDPASLNTSSENLPEIEELLSDRTPAAEHANPTDQKETISAGILTGSDEPEAGPVSNPPHVSDPEDAINSTPDDPNVLVEAAVTAPAPAKSVSSSEDKQIPEPVPQVPELEPELSSMPPAVFIPAQLEPALSTYNPSDVQPLLSVPVLLPIRQPNPLNKNSILPISLPNFDPIPQEITIAAVPYYAEIKPLPPAQSPIDLEVSLFVPSRVSQDASSRALDLLTQGRATVVATARVGFRVKQTQVRYYHPDDAGNAALAADILGGVARDFTSSGSKTRPGRIEVYLAGSGSGPRRSSDPQPTEFDKFIARILNELR